MGYFITHKRLLFSLLSGVFLFCSVFVITGCNPAASNSNLNEKEIALPVYVVDTGSVVLTENFLGTVEGKINVEIRPQVGGELEEAYVDEGDFVTKGQKLFKINPQTYEQDLNQAVAKENIEKAKLANAELEVERLKPLIEHEVMAPIRLKVAQSNYEIAQANLKQASAEVANAKIQLSYTVIAAPVSGYIGRIPKRIGNVVNPGDKEPMTILSDVHEVYVYFSVSESNFYKLLKSDATPEQSSEKLSATIDTSKIVSLILSDGTIYPQKGIIDASSGQVNKNTGSILLRATFPNDENILRSGNTGTVVLNKVEKGRILIPQKATFELQANTFVKKLNDQNRVVQQLITLSSDAPNNMYVIAGGLKRGDRILVSGLDQVSDSTVITPLPYKQDSLIAPKIFSQGESDTSM